MRESESVGSLIFSESVVVGIVFCSLDAFAVEDVLLVLLEAAALLFAGVVRLGAACDD